MKKVSVRSNTEYTNQDIVVIAVHQLVGSTRHIHLEDVAMKAHELSPKRFCWKKYQDQIDLERVRGSLKSELGLSDNRILGSIRDGWMLTPNGLEWCRSLQPQLDTKLVMDRLNREVTQAKNTDAFKKVSAGNAGKVSRVEVEALLRIDEYSTVRNRRERALALSNAAVFDEQLRLALESLKVQGFSELEVQK